MCLAGFTGVDLPNKLDYKLNYFTPIDDTRALSYPHMVYCRLYATTRPAVTRARIGLHTDMQGVIGLRRSDTFLFSSFKTIVKLNNGPIVLASGSALLHATALAESLAWSEYSLVSPVSLIQSR